MISPKELLRKLPPYKRDLSVFVKNQSVGDIQEAIEAFHEKCKEDYDKIYMYFLEKSALDVSKKIFDFLKNNTRYVIEGLDMQTVRTPSAILATAKIDGVDCKNLSLFAGGVLDAINRSGKMKIPFAYRYAVTDLFGTDYNHVFIVVNPGSDNELFIDPIDEVDFFNKKFDIYSFKDKKTKSMLYGVAGRKGRVGFTIPVIGIDTDDVGDILNIGKKLFSGSSQPSRNDWRGWNAQDQANKQWLGSSVRGWVLNDGDDVNNEALNILSYIQANGLDNLINTGKKNTVDGVGFRDVTVEEIARKFDKGGLMQEAAQLREAKSGRVTPVNPTGTDFSASALATRATTTTGGVSPLIYIGGAIVAAKLLKLF